MMCKFGKKVVRMGVVGGLLLFTCWPAQAQIPQLEGRFLDLADSLRNDMPGKASEGFVKPTVAQLAGWRSLVVFWASGQVHRADSLRKAQFPWYSLSYFKDTDMNGQTYLLLREASPISRGWGTLILNPGWTRPICIEIPHPIYDTHTCREGMDIFRRTGAAYLIMAGTHRCADAEPSPCDGSSNSCGDGRYHVSDMAHYTQTPFQVAHEAITALHPEVYAMSLHGNSRSTCEDIFLSNGHPSQTVPMLANIKADLLAAGGLTVAVAGEATSVCSLVGSTNVQGRFTNGSPQPCSQAASQVNGHFIHIEQHRSVRDHFAEYRKLIDAVNRAIPAVTAVKFPARVANPRLPESPELLASFPNPFEGRTAIRYEIHRATTITAKIYDLNGRLVRILQPQIRQRAGAYTLTWDGHGSNGRRLPNGLYFIELISDHHVKTGKLWLLR